MLSLFASMMLMAQGGAAADAPGREIDFNSVKVRRAPSCQCPAEPEEGVFIVEGLVVDAEVTLGADGLSVNDRQTTVFDVSKAPEADLKGRTRIWHTTKLPKCGVTFDYGLKYRVAVRKLEDGSLETDECLMRLVRPASDQTETSSGD